MTSMARYAREGFGKIFLASGLALVVAALLIAGANTAKNGGAPRASGFADSRVAPTIESADHANPSQLAARAVLTSFVDQPMCRFGYAVTQNPLTDYNANDIARLRGGWYYNYGVLGAPPRPNGIEFAQTVSVKQLKTVNPSYTATYMIPYTFTVSPPLSTLASVAGANPGALWLVGNEIERRDWQCGSGTCGTNEILPEVYADAYQQIHTAIKNADPTAQVAISGLVLVSPLRLKYLDRIWDAYLAKYGTPIPVDVWNIHPYMLPEVQNGNGADIPAGLTETVGVLYADWQNDDLNAFQQQVVMFRQWMAAKGEQGKPLIISEFGVLYPTWFTDSQRNAYSLARVKNFMLGAYNYLLTAKDASLGFAPDDYRLVQRWNWFSLDWDPTIYNGNLFSYTIKAIDQLGLDWQAYVTDTSKPFGPPLNLKMLLTDYSLGPVDGLGQLTATVKLQMSNSGFLNWSNPITVQVSQMDGTFMGQTTLSGLHGCGKIATATLTLPNLSVGPVLFLKAMIDPDQATPDSDFTDNSKTFTLITDPIRTFLPLIRH